MQFFFCEVVRGSAVGIATVCGMDDRRVGV
jgi:hypothetical protein